MTLRLLSTIRIFSEKYYNTLRNIVLFNKKIDWTCELARCGATGWRVLSLDREDSVPSGTLPMHFVIPRSITETDYFKLANCFRNGRTAVWVYSLQNASLIRMAELMPTITDTRQENTILEIVRKCDPLMRQPFILELGKLLPNIQDVQISFTKLRDLFTPDTTRQFMVSSWALTKCFSDLCSCSTFSVATRRSFLQPAGQNVLAAVRVAVHQIRRCGRNKNEQRRNGGATGE